MSRKISWLFCIPLGLMIVSSVWAEDLPGVNRLFSDHMVLQRDRPVPVWGTAKPGTTITVKFGQQRKTAETGTDGKWRVRLDAMKASAEPAELTVKSLTGDKPVTIADVLVGDVWLCSGQSNMEMQMERVKADDDNKLYNKDGLPASPFRTEHEHTNKE